MVQIVRGEYKHTRKTSYALVFYQYIKLIHVTFYRCFGRLLGSCIINEVLKVSLASRAKECNNNNTLFHPIVTIN